MDTSMIVRAIVLVFALVNQILTAIGKNPLPFSDDTLYEIVTVIVTIIASAWAWWKNNNITSAAKLGQTIVTYIKSGKLSEETVKAFIETVNKTVDDKYEIVNESEEE